MSELDLEDELDQKPGWELIVDPQGEGERLDHFIARRIPRLSRARASRLEVIDLDEPRRHLKKSNRLHSAQRLWIKRPPPKEDISSLLAPDVLYEGDGLMVVNKPPGWAVHPTASRFESTITTWLKRRGTPAIPAHRLDVETSGILVCTYDPKIERAVKASFKTQQVQKKYLAMTKGNSRQIQDELQLLKVGQQWQDTRPLGFDTQSQIHLKMGLGCLASSTTFKVRSVGKNYALIEAMPHTGRQHQIRAHLALSALPLIGDKLYGSDENLFLKSLMGELSEKDWQELGHKRQALHASELSVQIHGHRYHWKAPLPNDLKALMFHLEHT